MLRNILTLSALIAAMLLVRALFRNRVPKRMLYALWLVVLLKLCLPGTLVSLPVLPAQETAAPAARAELPAQTAAQAVTQPEKPAQQPVSPAQEAPKLDAKPLTATQILQIIWICGSVLLGLWLFGSWLVFTIRLCRNRRFLGKRGSVRIYASGAVKSPCLAGLLPAVYLTEDVLQTDEAALILRHELTHLHHLDFIWSFCRASAVVIYWWNPLVWLAAICSKRDAELACDEAVAAGLDSAQRLAYARAILAQAPRKTAALSLAGPPVKERILFLTKKRRTSAVCVVLALLLVVSATGCSFAELTRKESGTIPMPEEPSADTASEAQTKAQAEAQPAQAPPQQNPDTAAADNALPHDEIWTLVHEKLDSARWVQDMTPEYEEAVRAFQLADSETSDDSGDVSQWPHYYSAFVDYFSDTNADLRYLDEDTFWTTDLSEDGQTLIVTLTRADAVLTLSYSLRNSQIAEISTRRNVVIQNITDDSITVEPITLLNSFLEEDLQILKALNIPPEEYQSGYYQIDSGDIYTYQVDPDASVTSYDFSSANRADEDRLHTFDTWKDFVSAVGAYESPLIQPYTLTLQNGVVVKIEEKFYN